MKKFLKSSYMALVMIMIYLPIFILILFSFNSSSSMGIFSGFSTKWYKDLFAEQPFIASISVSLFTAIIATIVSTILGTLAAIGLTKSRRLTQKMTLSITNIPLINADVITAVALMLVFIVIGLKFGILTLILAHISFDIPYVIMTVLPRLRKVDANLIEASLDLGAKPSKTLRKVVLPILKPAIISGAAIAFAMSFDDFIISYFTGGPDVNVSTFIYTMKRIQPFVNSFGTICIVIISSVVVGWNGWQIYKTSYQKFRQQILKGTYKDKDLQQCEIKLSILYHILNSEKTKDKTKENLRKKIIYYEKKYEKIVTWIGNKKVNFINDQISQEEHNKTIRKKWSWFVRAWKPMFLTIISLAAFGVLTAFYVINSHYDLIIANWGSYIDPKLLTEFDNQYHVKVKYTVYDSNETLYNKLYTTNYDIMVPSDYMVSKLASENKLQEINYNYLNQITYNNYNHLLVPAPNDSYSIKSNDNSKNPLWFDTKAFNSEWSKDSKVNYIHDFYKNYYSKATNLPSSANDKSKLLILNNALLNVLNENSVKIKNSQLKQTIADYCIPYFWGSVSLVINPSTANINWINSTLKNETNNFNTLTSKWTLEKPYKLLNSFNQTTKRMVYKFNNSSISNNYLVENSNGVSWNWLWLAANAGKKVLLSDDYRNLFMLANEKQYFSPLPSSKKQIDSGADQLKTLIHHSNVALMNDEIINAVGDGNFDFAFMYNGDAIAADQMFAQSHKSDSNNQLIIVNPNYFNYSNQTPQQEGTNIWSDNLVISKQCKNLKLAYEFIAFILNHQSDLTSYTDYTSPYQQVINYELNYQNIDKNKMVTSNPSSNLLVNYQAEYIPVAQFDENKKFYYSSLNASDGPFKVTQYDDYMVDIYNKLIAGKY